MRSAISIRPKTIKDKCAALSQEKKNKVIKIWIPSDNEKTIIPRTNATFDAFSAFLKLAPIYATS